MSVGSHVAVRNHEDFFLNFLQWYHLEIILVSYREPQQGCHHGHSTDRECFYPHKDSFCCSFISTLSPFLCPSLAVDNMFSISTILSLQILHEWHPTVLWGLALFTRHDSQGMHRGCHGH